MQPIGGCRSSSDGLQGCDAMNQVPWRARFTPKTAEYGLQGSSPGVAMQSIHRLDRMLRLPHAGGMLSFMSDVTRILSAIEQGDPNAASQLLPLVYDELRRLAAQRLATEGPGHTRQPTGLDHEAYLKLAGPGPTPAWHGRGHCFAACADARRRILIAPARRKHRARPGGGMKRVDLEDLDDVELVAGGGDADELLALDEAQARLAAADPRRAELVRLRYFAGLTLEQAAELLGISRATADRHWAFARAWLYDAMTRGQENP